jgi:hypothetical protein
VLDYGIEDNVEDLRVDQMPFGLDDLAMDGRFFRHANAENGMDLGLWTFDLGVLS